MIKALVDKIIVQEMRKEKTKGGLIIPDTVQEPQTYGVILSIGETVKAPIKVGDLLVFHSSAGMAMMIEGKFLRCLMEAELYGVEDSLEIIESLTPLEIKQADLDQIDEAAKKQQAAMVASGGGGSRIIKV
jgi:chaperonin GroES